MRSLGSLPIRRRGTGPECTWRYALDGPLAPGETRTPVVTVRLARDAAALATLAGLSAGESEDVSGPRRVFMARGERWAATVEVDGARCGETSGAALAQDLVHLAP